MLPRRKVWTSNNPLLKSGEGDRVSLTARASDPRITGKRSEELEPGWAGIRRTWGRPDKLTAAGGKGVEFLSSPNYEDTVTVRPSPQESWLLRWESSSPSDPVSLLTGCPLRGWKYRFVSVMHTCPGFVTSGVTISALHSMCSFSDTLWNLTIQFSAKVRKITNQSTS